MLFICRVSGRNVDFKSLVIMETKVFKGRLEEVEWLDAQKGWGPLSEEDKKAIDDAVRMVTNLN